MYLRALRGELRDCQIDLIGALIEGAKKTSESLSREKDSKQRLDDRLIARSAQRAAEMVDELRAVFDGCTEKVDDDKWKAKKRKWVLKENRMGKLRLKAEGAKSTLHMAMTNLGNQQLAMNNRLITDNMALVSLRYNEHAEGHPDSSVTDIFTDPTWNFCAGSSYLCFPNRNRPHRKVLRELKNCRGHRRNREPTTWI